LSILYCQFEGNDWRLGLKADTTAVIDNIALPCAVHRRTGTTFWLGESKSRGLHFEESTNLL